LSYDEKIIKELSCEELEFLSSKQRMGSKSKTRRLKEAIRRQMRMKMCLPKNITGF
jgi:hypothetical protein